MKKMQQGTEKSREHLLNKGLTIPVKYAITNPIYHLKSFFITKIFQISEITSFFMVES